MLARLISLSLLALSISTSSALGNEPVDLDVVTRIRDEGFHRSQVMDIALYLTDTIGPRVTASPASVAAHQSRPPSNRACER